MLNCESIILATLSLLHCWNMQWVMVWSSGGVWTPGRQGVGAFFQPMTARRIRYQTVALLSIGLKHRTHIWHWPRLFITLEIVDRR